jgi:hypothetical protein
MVLGAGFEPGATFDGEEWRGVLIAEEHFGEEVHRAVFDLLTRQSGSEGIPASQSQRLPTKRFFLPIHLSHSLALLIVKLRKSDFPSQ